MIRLDFNRSHRFPLLFREALTAVNVTEGHDYNFECKEFLDSIMEVVSGDDPLKIGVVGGLPIIANALRMSFKFSQPTMVGGLSLLVRGDALVLFEEV